MTEKSHVSMEEKYCLACGREYSTGGLLLDRRLRPIFERTTVTGWGLCEEHQESFKQGKLVLVEVDPAKCPAGAERMHPNDVFRTGLSMIVDREHFNDGCETPVPATEPVAFVEVGMFEKMLGKERFREMLKTLPKAVPAQNAPSSNSAN